MAAPEIASRKQGLNITKFEGFFVPPERNEKLEPRSHERIIVVSDLHGADDEVTNRLKAIPIEGENKPAAVILGGDIVGNPALGELQKLYYNHLTNHTRNGILSDPNASISDNQLLSHKGNNPPDKEYSDGGGYSVEKGFLRLRKRELELEGFDETQVKASLTKLPDDPENPNEYEKQVAAEIRRYAKYHHYGHYASNLPEKAVQKLAEGLDDSAKKIAGPLKKLRDARIKVSITEGNWDPRPPISFKRGTDKPEALSAKKQKEATGFSTEEFFKDHGIEYATSTHIVETDTAALVLLPFDQLVRYSVQDIDIEKSEAENLAIVRKAREAGKQVIVIQHGEVMWEPHNLTDPDSKPKGEHKEIIEGSNKINKLLEPDEIVHGHIHDPFSNEDGIEQPVNTKYVVVFENTPTIIPAKDRAKRNTVVSHMPLHRFANVLIPYDNENNQRQIQGLGGERYPAEVT